MRGLWCGWCGNSVKAFSCCYCLGIWQRNNQRPVPAQPALAPSPPSPKLLRHLFPCVANTQCDCCTPSPTLGGGMPPPPPLSSSAHLFLNGNLFSGVLVSRVTGNQVRGPDLWGKVWEKYGGKCEVANDVLFKIFFSGGQVWTPDCRSSPCFMSTLPWLQ